MNAPGNAASEPAAQERRRWARQQLGATDEVDVRSRMLECLDAEDFVPDPAQHEAIAILSGRSTDEGRTEEAGCFESTQSYGNGELIEEFARGFFSAPAQERRRRWQALKRLPHLTPPQRMRLEELQRGLDVVLPTPESSSGTASTRDLLVGFVAELFVLNPVDRAHRRGTILNRIQRESERDWSGAAEDLLRSAPGVLHLLPKFVGELELWTTDDATVWTRAAELRSANVPESSNEGDGLSFGRWSGLAIVAVWAFASVVRFVASNHVNDDRFTPSSPVDSAFDLNHKADEENDRVDRIHRRLLEFDETDSANERTREELQRMMREGAVNEDAQRRLLQQKKELELDRQRLMNRLVDEIIEDRPPPERGRNDQP